MHKRAAAEDRRAAPGFLRVASYNIHRTIGLDRRRDPARIAAVINELNADIVGLQEVDWHHDHEDEESQFEYLAHLPGYRAVAGPNIHDHRGHYGNLLLSRVPVHRVRRVDLTQGWHEPRGVLDVDVRLRRFQLRLMVTHLGLGLGERWRQTRRLREMLAERAGEPTLILGDFNDWLPGRPTLQPLLRVCDLTPTPASYPSHWPVLALDRILACSFPLPLRIRAHASPLARWASDHLPIVADIDFGPVARRHRLSPPSARAAALDID